MQRKSCSRRQFLMAMGLGTVSTVLAACAQPSPAPAQPEPTAAEAATSAPEATSAPAEAPAAASEPMAFTLAMTVTGTPSADDCMTKVEVEKAFNVKLTLIQLERDSAQEQLKTRIAGGDIPDLFNYEGDRVAFFDQAVVAEIPYEVLAQSAPRYTAALKKENPRIWLPPAYKGKNMGIPWMNWTQAKPFCDAWRKDSLVQVGIEKTPETIEEYEEAYTKILEAQLQPYGWTTQAKGWMSGSINAFFGAYGTFPCFWMEKEDKSGVEWGLVTDGAREALAVLNRWYKNGVLHPEFITHDWTTCVQLWCQGQLAYSQEATWYRLTKGGELYDCLDKPEEMIEMAWPPKGPQGKFGYFGWGIGMPPGLVGKQVTGAKLEALLKFYDSLAADPEWATFLRYGREGEHCERDETGALLLKPEIASDEAKQAQLGIGGMKWWQVFMPINDVSRTWYRKDIHTITERAEAGNVNNYLNELTSLMDPEVLKATTDLQPALDKWESDFILGNVSLDKWGDFIKDFEDQGGKAQTEAANVAYQGFAAALDAIESAVSKI